MGPVEDAFMYVYVINVGLHQELEWNQIACNEPGNIHGSQWINEYTLLWWLGHPHS